MLRVDYLNWFHEKVGPGPFQAAPAVTPETEIFINWPLDAFRCDPFRCKRVCCLTSCIAGGIPLLVEDLLRLQDGQLLDSVAGAFSASRDALAYIDDPSDKPVPGFPRLRTLDGHCVHYDPQTRGCGIYEHRPYLCRTFPYLALYDTQFQLHRAWYNGDCSVRPDLLAVVPLEQLRKDPASGFQLRKLRLDEFPDYDRRHIEASFANNEDQARTMYLVAHRPDLLESLGLAAFVTPDSAAPS